VTGICADGFCLLDKVQGTSSFQALDAVKRALGTGKVGHAGTLDRFATGLLIALGGRYTRLAERFMGGEKEYLAEFVFGIETDTLDPEGSAIARAEPPTEGKILDSLELFRGEILQAPPVYSAVHIGGRRAHALARRGETPEMPARQVRVSSFDLLSFSGEKAEFRIKCSKGTYVRSLARDLALACGSRAYVGSLRRTASGSFRVEDGVSSNAFDPRRNWLKMDSTVARRLGLEPLEIDPSRLGDFCTGKTIDASWFGSFRGESGEYAIFDSSGSLVGLARFGGGGWSYEAVFGVGG
jgi:tRNA pseudouridine55 synthase